MTGIAIINELLRGFCVGLASSITVGPAAIMVIQRTLSKSRGSGMASGLGVACADMLMAVIAFFFYSMLQSLIEQYTAMLRICGGIIVIIVGVRIFFKKPEQQLRRNRTGKSSFVQDFISMFSLTLTFFYIIIPYLLAFFSVFGSVSAREAAETSSVAGSIMVIGGFFAGAVTWWTSLTMLISLFRRRFKPRHMITINRAAGIIILLLGIYTVMSTFINIMPDGIH